MAQEHEPLACDTTAHPQAQPTHTSNHLHAVVGRLRRPSPTTNKNITATKTLPPARSDTHIPKRTRHATRTCTHVATGVRQTGHSFILAEQLLQAHWWPHGTATCDLGLLKQMMHVVWPPMVDSGTSGRPVSKCAVASDITMTEGDGGLVSATDAIAATGAAAPAPASDELDGTCKLAWPSK